MKINQELRLSIDKGRNNQHNKVQDQVKFGELVQKQEKKLQFEQLTRLMSEMDTVSQRLYRSRTFKDLAAYKDLVKKFVHEAVEYGMDVKQSHSWNSNGQGRALKIVEQIDKELIDLTQDMIDKEKDSIDILGKIGIVKGLLINLYT